MNICLHTFWDITHNFIGGTERFLIELSKELKILGFNPFIVCTGDNTYHKIQGVDVYARIPGEYKEAYYRHGEAKVALFSEIFKKKNVQLSLNNISRYINNQLFEFEYDVLHLNSFASSVFTHSQKPIIVTNHENESESENIWGDGFFSLLQSAINSEGSNFRSHSFRLVPTKYYADKYTKFFNAKIDYINLGVNISEFNPMPYKNGGRDDREIIVFLPSRMEPDQKGQDIAIYACKKLIEKGVNIKMIFSGIRQDNEKNVEKLRRLAFQQGVVGNIEFKSFSDIRNGYETADIIISPERYCSYGLSVSEALAVGKQTILSDIPTYKEIASKYSHAIFFKSGNSDDLACKILYSIQNIKTKSTNDTIKFRMKYDFRECAKNYARLYLSAAK